MIGDKIENYYSVQYRDNPLKNQNDINDFWTTIGGTKHDNFQAAYDYGVSYCNEIIEDLPEVPLSMRVLRTEVTITRELAYLPEDRNRDWELIE